MGCDLNEKCSTKKIDFSFWTIETMLVELTVVACGVTRRTLINIKYGTLMMNLLELDSTYKEQ